MIVQNPQAPGGTDTVVTISDTEEPVRLRLYIAGMTPNSRRAVTNLETALQETSIPRHFGVEHVDVLVETGRAAADSVIVTPALITVGTRSRLVIIGDLSNSTKLRAFLKAAASFG